jgi:hypothetical protein
LSNLNIHIEIYNDIYIYIVLKTPGPDGWTYRSRMKPRYSTTVLWGAIGEIGLRKAIYGSRDASWLKKHMAGSCCLVVPILLTSFIQKSKSNDCCDAEEETISSQRIRFIGYQIDDYIIYRDVETLCPVPAMPFFCPFRSWLGTSAAQLAPTAPGP